MAIAGLDQVSRDYRKIKKAPSTKEAFLIW